MAGVKTLADGNTRVFLLATKPADINAITVTELTAAAPAVRNLACNILASDFDLGPTGSETIDEKALCAKGNAQVFGLTNYGGGFTVFRYLDPTTGLPDSWMYMLVKSMPPVMTPMIGISRSATIELTSPPKAPPMITPMARSTMLPRNANSLNSFSMSPAPIAYQR